MRPLFRTLATSWIAAVLALAAAASALSSPPAIGRCPVFPPKSPWNQRVDRLPAQRASTRIIARVGAGIPLHPDFGSGLWRGQRIGLPYALVAGQQPLIRVNFIGADARYSDRVRYPLPSDAPIEDRPDRHVIVVNTGSCRLYELYRAQREFRNGGSQPAWSASSGATWDLRSTRLRPNGWTSADAAGLPIFPGLVRYDEVRRGEIRHALRLAVPKARRAWVYPARHAASRSNDPLLPAMGQRLRLKASINPNLFPAQARIIVRALQRYGVMVADEGAPMHLTGAPSQGWRMDQVFSLQRLRAGDFEVVDTSTLGRPSR
jgi:hypothetical protein